MSDSFEALLGELDSKLAELVRAKEEKVEVLRRVVEAAQALGG